MHRYFFTHYKGRPIPKKYPYLAILASIVGVNLLVEYKDGIYYKHPLDWPDIEAGVIGGVLAFPILWASDNFAHYRLKRIYLRDGR